jgi:GNAT superfamily N-acetyltransferase
VSAAADPEAERAIVLQRTALADWVASLAESSPGARLLVRDGVSAAAAPACPERGVTNSACFRDAAAFAAMLDELAAFYEEAGVDAWDVWVPEFETDAIALLEAAGHAFDGKPLAMTVELAQWRAPELGDLDWDGAADPATLGKLNDLAYGIPPEVGIGRGMSLRSPRMRLYQARVEGEPACALATIDHAPEAGTNGGGDLGFYWVATHPDHRGRGLCSRLMAAAMLEARERGLATSSLQASAAGESVYARLGFSGHFRWNLYERRKQRSGT